MTTSTPPTTLDPDEPCGVCDTARADHGDMKHEFNADGDLIPIKAGPPPKKEAPQHRDDVPTMSPAAEVLAKDVSTQMVLRMVERMTAKGLLNGEDLQYIFGA